VTPEQNNVIGMFIITFVICTFFIHWIINYLLYKILLNPVKSGRVQIAENAWWFATGCAMVLFVSVYVSYLIACFMTAIIAFANGWLV
jgi:hypothetical protein